VISGIRTAPNLFRGYDPPARRNLARNFPFAVVYLDEPDRVWILAVMPLRRHPDYWKHRLV
jgi:toxin ParE1/3/4